MLFPLISAPILSRLYSPSEFGVYAVYFAIATILTVLSSLCMHNAIILEDDQIGQMHALFVACGLTLMSALVTAAVIAATPGTLLVSLGVATDSHVERWLPLTVLIGGLSASFYAWATKNQRYRELGRNKLILASLTAVLQIGIGFLQPGPSGFVIANLIGMTISLILLVKICCANHQLDSIRIISFRQLIRKFNEHYRLALWTLPATLVNTVSSYLPDLLIGRNFGTAQLGQYSLANRMISMPLSFVTTSAQEFFRQQAADEYGKDGSCQRTFNRFFVLLILFSLVAIVPMLIAFPFVFPLIFGKQWVDAGEIIQCLAFLLIVRFVSSPLSYVWIIAGKQKEDFFWQIGLVVISAGALLMPKILMSETTLQTTLFIYSAAVGAWYVLCIVMSYRFANGKKRNERK